MSDILNEQLSALLDGELPPEETTLLMKRLEREPELAQRLARYSLCGDVLRGERAQPRPGFANRVCAAVAAEPALASPDPRPAAAPARAAARRWLRPVAGLAVAASVALVAVLVLQQGPGVGPSREAPAATLAATPAPAAAPAVRLAHVEAPLATQNSEPASYVTPAAAPPRLAVIPETTLANYVVAHSEVSTPLAGRSVLIHLIADEPDGAAPAR